VREQKHVDMCSRTYVSILMVYVRSLCLHVVMSDVSILISCWITVTFEQNCSSIPSENRLIIFSTSSSFRQKSSRVRERPSSRAKRKVLIAHINIISAMGVTKHKRSNQPDIR
jgi:hypothetical protein